MNRDFEKKVRNKKIRAAALAVLIAAIAVFLIWDTNVEKADYADSLSNEIAASQQLYSEASANIGNGEGQYAPYTLLTFQRQVNAASNVAASENSGYEDKKAAYEWLKSKNKAFEKAANKDTLSRDDARKLAKGGGKKTFESELKEDSRAVLSVSGSRLKNPCDMNFMVREKGPYYGSIAETMGEMDLSGQVVTFYQDGSFGGRVGAVVPFYTEKAAKGYTYKIDLKSGKLKFVSEAKIAKDAQTAEFTVSEGGDYIIVTEKLHKDGKKKAVDIKKEKKKAAAEKNRKKEASVKKSEKKTAKKAAEKTGGKTNTVKKPSAGGTSPAKPPVKSEEEKISVSLEIRCDALSKDLSQLENSSTENYVPKSGVILSVPQVKVSRGATVYDVLSEGCRNRNIQVESAYTPAYGTRYVEGINYLYEFDAGSLSGWMYKVNGKFPNYGCSEFEVRDGDRVVWLYTCNLGKDIGGRNSIK